MNTPSHPPSSAPGPGAGPDSGVRQVVEESLGYQLRVLLASLRQQADNEFEASGGLTSAQWIPLIKLLSGEASSVVELSRICHLDGGATTRMLDRLEAKGLLRRVRSSVDRRVVNLELTPEGIAAARRILPVLRQVQDIHLRDFTPGEWALFKSFLKRAIANGRAHAQAGAQGNDQP
ncbi:MarR family winged helix-turn-helix transcriptional regulator [Ramlibacter sp. H39-3-26]|uniref:MarR family winged helix-turn-helix transcriptional regulator n=1 Tax=Curvibacter soli TaxID=3031331 RepID=UPI0023DC13CA|nr:MarR family winged helix-turn-helix transcriptional regulator [Ramlibacter sp. H39-3-26]MDF1483976.1 MarR family winged helix-turn-helix transcriptional regulator [Ramlibacter sp. H39-3-26]